MDEKQKANTTALPLAEKPEAHEGRHRAISLEQDKKIRDGFYERELNRDDQRMKDLPDESGFGSGVKVEDGPRQTEPKPYQPADDPPHPKPEDTPAQTIPGKPIPDMAPPGQDEPEEHS
jgi:hypothetical protein